jgi:hypothetical protein
MGEQIASEKTPQPVDICHPIPVCGGLKYATQRGQMLGSPCFRTLGSARRRNPWTRATAADSRMRSSTVRQGVKLLLATAGQSPDVFQSGSR